MNLIQLQDEAIRLMSQPRTSEKRGAKLRKSVAIKFYRPRALKMGYPVEQVDQQIRDVYDMVRLEQSASE